MITNLAPAAPVSLIAHLNSLLILLKSKKNDFETISSAIPEKELERSVISLAQETNQFAQEISSQLETLGEKKTTLVTTGPDENPDTKGLFVEKTPQAYSSDDVLYLCMQYEKKIIKAYHTILQEPLLIKDLREMLRRQLNGIVSSFLNLKLYSSVTRKREPSSDQNFLLL